MSSGRPSGHSTHDDHRPPQTLPPIVDAETWRHDLEEWQCGSLSRRDEAKNVATLGGDSRIGQVLGREAAGLALSEAMKVAAADGATVTAALLVDGEPAKALVTTATERNADLIVLGSLHDRTWRTGCSAPPPRR